jgi:hypothetical protein
MDGRRFRQRFVFWLNTVKDDEFALAEEIDRLKADRSFAKTIRDGIRLILDLRAKRVDVLFELFPWIKTELPAPPDDKGDLKKEIDFLKELMLSQYRGDGGIKMASVGQGPKPLTVNAAPIPVYDDDDDELVIRKDETSGERSQQNFINSMLALNAMPSKKPPVEVDTSSSFLDMF